MSFNGLHMSMGNLSRLSHAETRSISAENFTGEKGKGGTSYPTPNKSSDDSTLVSDHGVPIVVLENPNRV